MWICGFPTRIMWITGTLCVGILTTLTHSQRPLNGAGRLKRVENRCTSGSLGENFFLEITVF